MTLFHPVTQLLEALRNKLEVRGFDSRWYHWNFSSPQRLTEMSTRGISWRGKGGLCVGVTTLPLPIVVCLEILVASTSRDPKWLSRHEQGLLHRHGAIPVQELKGRLRLKCDGIHSETTLRLSEKRTIPFKSAGASVQSTTGSRVLRISGSDAGYITFRGSVKSTGYPLHSLVSPSPPFPCANVCHHISTGV